MLCVCMYNVCVHACVYVHMHACVYLCMYVLTHIHIVTYIYVHVYVNMFICTYLHVFVTLHKIRAMEYFTFDTDSTPLGRYAQDVL